MENIAEIEEKGIYSYIYVTYKTNRYAEYKRCIMISDVLNAQLQFIQNDQFMLSTIDVSNDTLLLKRNVTELVEDSIKTEGIYNYIQKFYKWNSKEFKLNVYKNLMSNEKYIDLHICSLKLKEVLF